MKRSTCTALAWGLASLLASPTLWAARPLVSDTADSLAAGDCEWESAAFSVRQSGQPTARGLDTLVACGVGRGTQVSAGYSRLRAAGQTDQTLALVGKTNLVDAGEGGTGLAIAYSATLDKGPGTAWRHGSSRVFGVASRALAKTLLGHFNLGWIRTERDRLNATTWSFGVEGDGAVRWAADVYGDDRSRPWVSAGVIWPLAEKFNVNLAYAQGFEQPRARQVTLAFKLDF